MGYYALEKYFKDSSGEWLRVGLNCASRYHLYNLESTYDFQTQSDCEIILALYKEKGVDFVDDLNGIFGFAIYDVEEDAYFIARDHMGIIPLYIGWDQNGTFYVASELKALESVCTKIELFPPGHYFHSKDGKFVQWYKRDWKEYDAVKDNETSIQEIKEALEMPSKQARCTE